MARLVLLGGADASRTTPLLRALVARGHQVRWVRPTAGSPTGAEGSAIGRSGIEEPGVEDGGEVALDDVSLAEAFGGHDAAVATTRGADTASARRAAVIAGVPLVDTDPDLAGVRAARDAQEIDARRAHVALVPGVSWRTVIGDLAAAVAARHVTHVDEVHVTYVVPDRGGVLAAVAPDGRHGLAAHLPGPIVAHRAGRTVEERLGEHRRLAWFPRPLGPHHAASAPGLESLTIPTHLEVDTVCTYVAASSLRAELLQATGNLARWRPGAARLDRWLRRPGVPLGDATRWACVAEVAHDGVPVRGWANGRDPDAVTTAAAVALLEALLDRGDRDGGVLAPAQVAPPDVLLDALSVAADLRWSVTTPDAR